MKRALLAALLLAGCQSIVGIEDRYYPGLVTGTSGSGGGGSGVDGGDDGSGGNSPACESYCDVVLKECTGTNAVYTGRATCLGVCKRLDPGDPLEPVDGNTVACRKRQAELAAKSEPNFYCRRAGPGGGGTCGTNCAAYCDLMKSSCSDLAMELNNCETQCSALRDNGRFDVDADHGGDTIQCRLVHVSSATVDPVGHCGHAQLRPSPPWCLEDQTKPPDCNEFCRLQMAACPGDRAAYESVTQCLAVCGALPLGLNSDRNQNTSGCRQYHCYNSLLDPVAHCPHTGPGGDGHCGLDVTDDFGNCHAYCGLLEKACTAQFATKFASQANCQKDCSNQPLAFGARHDSGYNLVMAQTGNTLACRLLHVSRALTDPMECPSALGEGVCK